MLISRAPRPFGGGRGVSGRVWRPVAPRLRRPVDVGESVGTTGRRFARRPWAERDRSFITHAISRSHASLHEEHVYRGSLPIERIASSLGGAEGVQGQANRMEETSQGRRSLLGQVQGSAEPEPEPESVAEPVAEPVSVAEPVAEPKCGRWKRCWRGPVLHGWRGLCLMLRSLHYHHRP